VNVVEAEGVEEEEKVEAGRFFLRLISSLRRAICCMRSRSFSSAPLLAAAPPATCLCDDMTLERDAILLTRALSSIFSYFYTLIAIKFIYYL
jgi:hypothetical protein